MFSFIDVLLFIVDVKEHIGLKELPYLTILAAIGAVLTEAWSVWENMPSHDTRTIEDNLAKSKELVKQVATLFNELKQQGRIMAKYFTFDELERSAKARQLGIENKIPRKYLANAEHLMECLDKVREAYGKPIRIS